MGYHPRKVKKIVVNSEINVTDTSGLLPLVASSTTTISPIVKISENMTPACVCVASIASAMLASQSPQITMLIELRKRGGYIYRLDLTRRIHQRESYEHDERTDHKLVS